MAGTEAGQAREDSLLLLRRAVRYSAQGEGQQGCRVEPWEEFPVNHGMLCPKGIKRYLQNEHPDRLLSPLIRDDKGFREATWDEALNRTVHAIQEIQERYGRDSFAVLGGASMTNEKAYLIGKF